MFVLRIFSVTVLLSLISFLIYKDRYVSSGFNIIYYEIYYYLLTILIVIFFYYFLLIKSKSSLIKLYILLISSFIGLFIVEILLNHINLEKNYKTIDVDYSNANYFDKRDKLTYYQDRKKVKMQKITLTVPTDTFYEKNNTILPLAGKSKSLSILCNESGKYIEFFSDRYGFNNDDSVWLKTTKYC